MNNGVVPAMQTNQNTREMINDNKTEYVCTSSRLRCWLLEFNLQFLLAAIVVIRETLHMIRGKIASRTHAGVHLGPTGTSHRCTSTMCTARYDMWQLCRTAYSSTNRRPSLLCRRTTSTEQAADGTETDRLFPPPTENIFVSVSGGARVFAARGKCLCCRPRQSDQFNNQCIFQDFGHGL